MLSRTTISDPLSSAGFQQIAPMPASSPSANAGHYPDEEDCTCVSCKAPFTRKCDLDKHRFDEHAIIPPLRILCIEPTCNIVFDDHDRMERHLCSSSGHNSRIPVEQPGESRRLLKSCFKFGIPYVCLWEPCFSRERVFQNIRHLSDHFEFAHTGQLKLFSCNEPRCNKIGDDGYKTEWALEEHQWQIHGIWKRNIFLSASGQPYQGQSTYGIPGSGSSGNQSTSTASSFLREAPGGNQNQAPTSSEASQPAEVVQATTVSAHGPGKSLNQLIKPAYVGPYSTPIGGQPSKVVEQQFQPPQQQPQLSVGRSSQPVDPHIHPPQQQPRRQTLPSFAELAGSILTLPPLPVNIDRELTGTARAKSKDREQDRRSES